MGKVISVVNHKGGVGKTTSTAHIAKALANLGKQVLMIDLDAQANLTACFINVVPKLTISDALVQDTPLAETVIELEENLSLIPSSLALASADYSLTSRFAREQILRKLIVPIINDYDYIIMDCPPALSIITTNALVSSDMVFIPLMAEALPMFGLNMLDKVLKDVKELNDRISIGAIFFTRYHNRKLDHTILDSIKSQYGETVMESKIRENVAAAEAPLAKQTTFDYAPNSNAAKDYMDLVNELISKGKL